MTAQTNAAIARMTKSAISHPGSFAVTASYAHVIVRGQKTKTSAKAATAATIGTPTIQPAL